METQSEGFLLVSVSEFYFNSQVIVHDKHSTYTVGNTVRVALYDDFRLTSSNYVTEQNMKILQEALPEGLNSVLKPSNL